MASQNTDALARVALHVPTILLPASGVDVSRWAIVACDQFTSEPEYWSDAERLVGDAPSTLNLIFPEVYLDKPGKNDRIKRINQSMQRYLDDGVLRALDPGFIVTERSSSGHTRRGLIVALDLDQYDFRPDAVSLIRAT